jgi:putative transposase
MSSRRKTYDTRIKYLVRKGLLADVYRKQIRSLKIIALKDVVKSNSMIESVNKIIKYNYLYPRRIQNQEDLETTTRKFVITDYNEKRPHVSLSGLTPAEAYGGTAVNFKKIREKMVEAHHKRVVYNKANSCMGCPFGCKN